MAKKLIALTRMSLRRAPLPSCGHTPEDTRRWDQDCKQEHDPKCGEWHVWEKGRVFTPPPHMQVDLALSRGIAQYAAPRASGTEEVAFG